MSFGSKRLSKRLIVPLVVGFLSLTSTSRDAFASPESDAKDLFARGRELRANNDCGSAAPLFRKAWTIYPAGLGSLRNLAECEEQLGHFASSRRSWLDLKRALVTAPNDPKYEGWDKDAEEAAARLKPKVATFVVDVYVKSPEGEALANEKTGVQIFVNGESVATTLVGTPLERDPGTYRIRAQVEDAQPVEQTVPLNAGDNPHVTIRLTQTPKPKNNPSLAVTTEDSSSRKTIGYVVSGVGAAALIGSGVTFLLRQSALSKLEDDCPSYESAPCPASKRSDIESTTDRGKLMSTLSPILLGVGLAGVGVGVALIVTAPSQESTPPPASSAGPTRAKTRAHTRSIDTLTVSAGPLRLDATWRF